MTVFSCKEDWEMQFLDEQPCSQFFSVRILIIQQLEKLTNTQVFVEHLLKWSFSNLTQRSPTSESSGPHPEPLTSNLHVGDLGTGIVNSSFLPSGSYISREFFKAQSKYQITIIPQSVTLDHQYHITQNGCVKFRVPKSILGTSVEIKIYLYFQIYILLSIICYHQTQLHSELVVQQGSRLYICMYVCMSW